MKKEMDKENEKNLSQVEDDFLLETMHQIEKRTGIERIIANDNKVFFDKEKANLLGQNLGNILYTYRFDELKHSSIMKKIKENLKDHRVQLVVLHAELNPTFIVEMMKEVKERGLEMSVVSDQEFKGDIGLVLAKKAQSDDSF
ncbi:hypothetical protein U473_13595 [Tepidibacillus decaturensis]|uniref:Uncharacterized protein n=2 Tax=Bacillaceae TaxID=186817 RepID=A0A135L7Q3_9BACI|nr:hypothetical protein U473_13595 [Tepidibacillus decaturensis]